VANDHVIREVVGEEIMELVYQLPGYSFHSSPPLQEKEKWKEIYDQRPGYRYFALYENNTPVACVAHTPMIQQVRGKNFPMGGVYDVVSQPSGRRKGYARLMMDKIFAVMHEESRPVTSLYPFRVSFYERLGYVSFPQPRWAKLLPANLGAVLDMNVEGEIDLVLISKGYDSFRDFLEVIQQRRHGMGLFANRPVSPGKRDNYWVAFAKHKGEIVGAMLYNLRGESEMQFDLRAERFYYLNNTGRYLLLDWIARHVDQARSVEILLPPDEQPETWLADIQVKVTGESFAGMGRVLDVSAIGGIEVGQGGFTAQIIDPHCPWNAGIWRFESVDGYLLVSREAQADCALKIQGLSALVYGTNDPQDIKFRGWGDPSPEIELVMHSIFPRMQPDLYEFF